MASQQQRESDVIIVGAGIAGLSAALALAPMRTCVLTKSVFGEGGSTPLAQGGIAAAMGADDTPALHAADTLTAAAGLAVREVVDVLTQEGPDQIRRLIDLGTLFDRSADGQLALGREAAHCRRRILHARGDATGAELVRVLTQATRVCDHVRVHERAFAHELLVEDGRVVGVLAVDAEGNGTEHRAPFVIIATGGIGQLFLHTTNPPEATGDGLAMAARAGARLADVEFVQFHPTALRSLRDPMPLLTEALRGEGAILVDEAGTRFMLAAHPDAELAPRDVVARAIWQQQMAGHEVFLDARTAVGARFPERFPTVWRLCRENAIDPVQQPMPVSPAAHYHMGGIDVDARGRASLAGLWACGEAAATGVHGANRLASNSLLEGLVFGARVAKDIASATRGAPPRGGLRSSDRRFRVAAELELPLRARLRALMWQHVGLVRNEAGLAEALQEIEELTQQCPAQAGELHNLLLVARILCQAALQRTESRGGHFRSDFPEARADSQRNIFVAVA